MKRLLYETCGILAYYSVYTLIVHADVKVLVPREIMNTIIQIGVFYFIIFFK